MKTLVRKLGLAAAVALLGLSPVVHADDHYDNKWKITVQSESDAAGSIGFTLTFEPDKEGNQRESVTVTAPIPENTGENELADLIAAAFKGTLGEDDFKIDVDWGEHVKVHADGDTPDFVVELSNNTVQGLSVVIKED